MTTETTKISQTIDITPTWRGIMPALIAAIQDGTPKGREIATQELMRLADIIDHQNATAKNKETTK